MKFDKMTDVEILAIANPIMDNLMLASKNRDHDKHTQDFTSRLKDIVSKDYLYKVCEQYQREKGFFTEREVVAVFKRPYSAAIVWKQLFSKVKGEYVAEMVLVYVDGQFKVNHSMITDPVKELASSFANAENMHH